MRRIRVQGLVKLANLVRRQLGGPVAPAALDELRRRVGETLEQLDLYLADEHLTAAALPAPSRKAYEFLKSVDFDVVETSDAPAGGGHLRGTVAITGLRGLLRRLLDRLSRESHPAALTEVHELLCARLEGIDSLLDAESLRPEHLKDETRSSIGWLRYFARRGNFDAYVSAVARSQPVFERAAAASGRFRPPVAVHFRPMKGMWRVRALADGCRIELPAAMICFPAEAFERLAAAAFRRDGSDEAIVAEMLSPACQGILAELEAISGGSGGTGGVHHDLGAAFERVNAAHFGGRLARPRLVWGRAFTMRKFGHYDRVHDTVMVSGSLDAAGVPDFVVEYIVYHELLHRELGVDWRRGRRAAHTGEFRRAERRFPRLAEAEAVLKRLAGGTAGAT